MTQRSRRRRECNSKWSRRIVRSGRTAGSVARIRPTEIVAAHSRDDGGSFAIEAHVTDPSGRDEIVRLHPTMDSGTLEGR